MKASVRDAWNAARPRTDHALDVACPAPWLSLEFDPSGWVYVCCASHLYPLGRIGDHSLTELWNGPRAQVLREALASWDLTVACGSCRWHLEHSRFDPVAVAYDEHRLDDPDRATPTMMQFALSNRCNFACSMCNPTLSSRLRNEAGLAPLPDRYDEAFFADLEPLLSGLRLAKFQGGEPFLIPEHRRVWEMLDALDDPPSILVTTNGSIWNDTVAWVVDRFDTQVSVSVDATTADSYSQIRRGGDFATLLENVERFDQAAIRQGRRVHVSFCLTAANWQELGPFLAWADRFDAPAAINLVSDKGLALHDLDVTELEAVGERWRSEDRGLCSELQANRGVWETQVAQLHHVIGQRRSDGFVPPRQSERVPPNWFTATDDKQSSFADEASHAARWRHERQRLRRWAEGGPVAELRIDAEGRVETIGSGHERLGLGPSLVGTQVVDLPAAIEAADGRPIWYLDAASLDGVGVTTFVLSATGVRGTPGSVVRVVSLPRAAGHDIVVAEDRLYERTSQPVPMPRRTRPGGSDPRS